MEAMVTSKNKNIHLEYHKELNYNFVGWNVRLSGGLAEYYKFVGQQFVKICHYTSCIFFCYFAFILSMSSCKIAQFQESQIKPFRCCPSYRIGLREHEHNVPGDSYPEEGQCANMLQEPS